MQRFFIFCAFLLILSLKGQGQEIEKIPLGTKEDGNNYYLVVKPLSASVKGVLVLLPGFGQSAESIFPETRLHQLSYLNEVLLVSLSVGEKIHADQQVVEKLNRVLKDVQQRFSLEQSTFVLGGFSAGGTLALRYTELCKEKPAQFPIQPQGVFTVDSPVDLVAIYQYFNREIKKNFSIVGVNEAVYVKNHMDRELGELDSHMENYIAHSPFYTAKENGNERFLKDVAVRVYHDIDIQWSLKNRRRSFFDNNELEASELINRLLLLGNERAEFMVGKKGYRSNGERHPHSWSIVDEEELIKWMKKLMAI